MLKALKQGKNSVAEYISRFDQYTGQTGWSDADHRTRFYDGLSEQLKDNLAISNRPITSLQELKAAAQVLDQRMRQREAEKKGCTYHTTSQAPSKDPNAMRWMPVVRRRSAIGAPIWLHEREVLWMRKYRSHKERQATQLGYMRPV